MPTIDTVFTGLRKDAQIWEGLLAMDIWQVACSGEMPVLPCVLEV
jgi:hypothetical protein